MSTIKRAKLVADINDHADEMQERYGFTTNTGYAQVLHRRPGESKDQHTSRIVNYGRWQGRLEVAQMIADHFITGVSK